MLPKSFEPSGAISSNPDALVWGPSTLPNHSLRVWLGSAQDDNSENGPTHHSQKTRM